MGITKIIRIVDQNLLKRVNPRSFHIMNDHKHSPSFSMMDFDIWWFCILDMLDHPSSKKTKRSNKIVWQNIFFQFFSDSKYISFDLNLR